LPVKRVKSRDLRWIFQEKMQLADADGRSRVTVRRCLDDHLRTNIVRRLARARRRKGAGIRFDFHFKSVRPLDLRPSLLRLTSLPRRVPHRCGIDGVSFNARGNKPFDQLERSRGINSDMIHQGALAWASRIARVKKDKYTRQLDRVDAFNFGRHTVKKR